MLRLDRSMLKTLLLMLLRLAQLIEVTYHVPAGMLITLWVASQVLIAFLMDVVFAAALPVPVASDGCVAHGTL